MALWSAALALSWLLPNHHPPWSNFHSDLWAAALLLAALVVVLIRSGGPFFWTVPHLSVLFLLPLPMLQHGLGQLPFIGEAWVGTAYLLGLLLALHLGARWQSCQPGQAMDALALAVGIAGLVSVVIQLIQWNELGDYWMADDGAISWRVWIVDLYSSRPYANIAQPNLLGTLLLWALLSVGWGMYRRKIGAPVAALSILLLLFGLALTQSRAAWLGLFLIVAATWYWRRHWPFERLPLALTIAAGYFVLVTLYVIGAWDGSTPAGDVSTSFQSRVQIGERPLAWEIFTNAILSQPWWGYGWNQVMVAHIAVATEHDALTSIFYHSHNLFLDLMLWFGLPIGLLASFGLIYWAFSRFRQVRSPDAGIPVLFLAVVGIHAMFEFPLHYGYFLFPAGVIAGTLTADTRPLRGLRSGVGVLSMMGLIAATLLALISRDYLQRIEGSFLAMRMEMARVGAGRPAETPEVWVLTQLREWLRLARYEVHDQMTPAEIQWITDVTRTNPVPANLHKLARALALNGRPAEAALWLSRIRQVVAVNHWRNIRSVWLIESRTQPKMAIVVLPPPRDD